MARPAASKTPRLDRLTEAVPEKLRTQVLRELGKLQKEISRVAALVGSSSSSGAPTGAPYVTHAISGALTNDRVFSNGTNTTVNLAVAGQISIDAPAATTTEEIQDIVGTMVVAGTGITVAYNDGLGTETISTTITQYTDELAQDAVGAMRVDSATVTLTYVDGTPSLTAAVVNGSIGTTQLTDDGVTFAKLLNATTGDILIGRDTGSGNFQEITLSDPFTIGNDTAAEFEFAEWSAEAWYGNPTGGDAVPVEVTPGPGLAWVGSTLEVVNGSIERTLYEVNYSTLANNTLVDGAETIDGLAYVAANMAELGTAAVQNGTGIRMIAATSNGGAVTMTSASQLIPYIYVPLSQITGYDPTATYIIEIYLSARILEANGEYVALGLWGVAAAPFASSDARMRAAKLVRNAGDTADVMRVTLNATDDTGDVDISTHNVMAIKVDGTGIGQAFSGTWAAGWPTSYTPHSIFQTAAAADSPLNSSDMRIFMGLGCANDASPTTSVTIERMRIRRVF